MKKENEKCEEFMNRFLMLDKNEHLPLSLTMHMFFCKKCRSEVRMFTLAEKACNTSTEKTIAIDDPSIASIMKAINPAYKIEDAKPLSLKKWIIGGILMIIAMLFFAITNTANDTHLTVAFYLVFAGAVTSYCAMFVGSHMDFFIKYVNKFEV